MFVKDVMCLSQFTVKITFLHIAHSVGLLRLRCNPYESSSQAEVLQDLNKDRIYPFECGLVKKLELTSHFWFWIMFFHFPFVYEDYYIHSNLRK